jgi:Gluconate 2-dehydrogenase subunit 3
MNRRKAIGRIFLAGIGGGLAFSGYKWYDWNKAPDIDYLVRHRTLIGALAETIIPATDTPGARDAGVGDFIVTMIKDCTDRMSANKFIDGLKDVEHYCQSHYQQPFEKCGGADQHATLQYFEEKGKPFKGIVGKAQNRWLGRSFFTTLKAYTVEGYCTSEAGATKGLAYLYIPGSYQGCIRMTPGQKAWATK